MKFLKHVLNRLPEYRSPGPPLIKNRPPAAVTGLSGIHKAHLIASLCSQKGRKAFVVSDEAEAQRLCNDLLAMGMDAMIYPARDFNFRDTEGQSREYEHQRLHVLARMLHGGLPGGHFLYRRRIAVYHSSRRTAPQNHYPPSRAGSPYGPGQGSPFGFRIRTLRAGGGSRTVRRPGRYCGFFTPDAPAPIRVEYWGEEIDTMSYFDVESQRRTDPVEEITLAPSTEILLSSPEVLAQKN